MKKIIININDNGELEISGSKAVLMEITKNVYIIKLLEDD